MARLASTVALLFFLAAEAQAQIRVNPTGVNVSGQGATTAFLTFGPLRGYVAAEAFWCGRLIPAAPALGARCDPGTLFGALPARYDRGAASGVDAFTDIMSIPPSVARRAYEAAEAGESAEFFYVRRFAGPAGSPDQYVPVTCRLTAGGARVPLSLVDVRLAFEVETPVLQVRRGQPVAPFAAAIQYTGTGRLRGRWEVVLPGQELPGAEDLLVEAALPAERRGTDRRYALIERFNEFLPPGGRVILKGPDPARLPTAADGQHVILLRIEASDDNDAASDLGAIGAGRGVVQAGAVAGFPLPVLRYVVGGGGSELSPAGVNVSPDLWPPDGATVKVADAVDLRWTRVPQAAYYRFELMTEERTVHQAFISPDRPTYRVPPFVLEKVRGAQLRWRVFAVDATGEESWRSAWRLVTVE